jgi:hypothetical protein
VRIGGLTLPKSDARTRDPRPNRCLRDRRLPARIHEKGVWTSYTPYAVGGIVGALLTGVFAAPSLGGFGNVESVALQLWIQFKCVAFTLVYSTLVTWLLLKLVDRIVGLRVDAEAETEGLDLALHYERGYII